MARLTRREMQARKKLRKQKPEPLPPVEPVAVGARPKGQPPTDTAGVARPLRGDNGHGA